MFVIDQICQYLKMLKIIQIWNSYKNNLGILFIDYSDLVIRGLVFMCKPES